jgi:hypothetical protein
MRAFASKTAHARLANALGAARDDADTALVAKVDGSAGWSGYR